MSPEYAAELGYGLGFILGALWLFYNEITR